MKRERATEVPDLPHRFDADPHDERFCAECGLDDEDEIHTVTAYRQTADYDKIRRELGS